MIIHTNLHYTIFRIAAVVYDRMQGVPRWSLLLIHGWVHNKRLLGAFFNSNRRFTKFNTVAAAQTSSSNSIFCVVCLQPVHVTG